MTATTMRPTTRRQPLLIVVALVVALGAGLYFLGAWPGTAVPIVREPVSQPLGAASRADVTVVLGVGRLRIGALEQSGTLIAGEIAYPDQNSVTRTFAVDDDTATFALREQDYQANSLIKYRNDTAVWDLRLAPATPLRLTLQYGIGDSTIDLAQLHVTHLTLETGIGATTLTLPQQGQVQAHVSGGVGDVTIRVPDGVAVRLMVDVHVGDVQFPDDYRKLGDAYVSPGYDTAANRVDLTASSGIGSITLQPAGE